MEFKVGDRVQARPGLREMSYGMNHKLGHKGVIQGLSQINPADVLVVFDDALCLLPYIVKTEELVKVRGRRPDSYNQTKTTKPTPAPKTEPAPKEKPRRGGYAIGDPITVKFIHGEQVYGMDRSGGLTNKLTLADSLPGKVVALPEDRPDCVKVYLLGKWIDGFARNKITGTLYSHACDHYYVQVIDKAKPAPWRVT